MGNANSSNQLPAEVIYEMFQFVETKLSVKLLSISRTLYNIGRSPHHLRRIQLLKANRRSRVNNRWDDGSVQTISDSLPEQQLKREFVQRAIEIQKRREAKKWEFRQGKAAIDQEKIDILLRARALEEEEEEFDKESAEEMNELCTEYETI
uniref:BTB domain-containing protein n=1 Tax=Ditylenchus dipsaci TaxID=166011 RepID=A0A915D2C9_9BILA